MDQKTILILLVLSGSSTIVALQYMFQGFNGCESNGVMDCTLRVRKVNRTTAALNGTIILHKDLDGSYETFIEVFHSPLGNNQFNRYPMKIGPLGFCEFMRTFWGDYQPYLAKYVTNLAEPDECPMRARTLIFRDLQLEAEMFPRYVPTGLWKLQWRMQSGKVDFFAVEMLFKVYENGYF